MAVGQKADPKRRRWTRKEYYRLSELGFFDEQRVQLIGGEIFVMAAQKNFHALGITLTEDALRDAFGKDYWVRIQMSLDLTPRSVPDQDLAVVPGDPRSHAGSADNPTTALLIVEVSETTLGFDRSRKSSLYACAGIKDYWILNLIDRQLEVYRDPVTDISTSFGWRYSTRTDLAAADTVTPLAAPNATIKVVDLLP